MPEIVAADGALTVHANEANAQITPHEQGQQRIHLPALEFSMVAAFECSDGAQADSITVSIADTYQRYALDELNSEQTITATLNVPESQIAPLAATEFCVAGEPATEKSLRVPGVATAQFSLRCRSGASSSVHFASLALPLRLSCVTAENQESSADK